MDLDLEGTVVSNPALLAPLSRAPACAVHVEALRGGVVVGALVLGDLVRLRLPLGEVDLVVRRAAFGWVTRFDPPITPRDPVAPELVPLLGCSPDGLRERRVLPGDRFRLRATVQRAGPAGRFVADDRSPIRLDELLALTS